GVAERDDLRRGVDLIEDVLEEHRAALVAAANLGHEALETIGDGDALGGALVRDFDRAELGRLARADETGQLLPGPAGPAHEQRLERLALRRGGGLIDDDRLDPLPVDHALWSVERDERTRAGKRNAAERALVEAKRPVALAAIVGA